MCQLLHLVWTSWESWLNLDIYPTEEKSRPHWCAVETDLYRLCLCQNCIVATVPITAQWSRNVQEHEHNHSCVSPSLRAVCPLLIKIILLCTQLFNPIILSTNVASDSQESTSWQHSATRKILTVPVVLKTKGFNHSCREKSTHSSTTKFTHPHCHGNSPTLSLT